MNDTIAAFGHGLYTVVKWIFLLWAFGILRDAATGAMSFEGFPSWYIPIIRVTSWVSIFTFLWMVGFMTRDISGQDK